MGNLSKVFLDKGEYKSAKEGYLKALEYYKKNKKEESAEYVEVLDNLSLVFQEKGEYKSALESY